MTATKQNEKEILMEGVVEETKEVVVEETKDAELVETEKPNYLQALITLWKRKSKDGTKTFLSGVVGHDNESVVGFYNGKKMNPNSCDLIIYLSENGNVICELARLWIHISASGNRYYSGVLVGKSKINIVGFIYRSDNEKAPYLKIYKQEDLKKDSVLDNSDEESIGSEIEHFEGDNLDNLVDSIIK